jgi:hypothetical protein
MTAGLSIIEFVFELIGIFVSHFFEAFVAALFGHETMSH